MTIAQRAMVKADGALNAKEGATHMPTVTSPNGRERHVKNLGWLRRHASEVESLSLHRHPTEELGGVLLAYLVGGRIYRSTFASASVMRAWINRPSFRGLPARDFKTLWTLDNVPFIVGQ